MRRVPSLLLAFVAVLAVPLSAYAQDWDGWAVAASDNASGQRFVHAPAAALPASIASYGPFRVIDGHTAALVGATDERSPAQFARMMRDYPALSRLELVECPGTYEDLSNLRLGRMIRAAGLVTHVPRGGSVRSGGVELFLAGKERLVDEGAEFAVHSWADEDGREATEYAADAPENRKYLSYYREMGMDAATAQQFYAMTNSVPYGSARWFGAGEMLHWIGRDRPVSPSHPATFAGAPMLAYLDLSIGVN